LLRITNHHLLYKLYYASHEAAGYLMSIFKRK